MRKIIAKISALFAIIGVILVVISHFLLEEGYLLFWLGVVVIIFSGIAYLASGEKVKDWFLELLNFL